MGKKSIFAVIFTIALTICMIPAPSSLCVLLGRENNLTIMAATKQSLPDGDYTIMTSLDTNYGLDLAANSTASGTNVQLYAASQDDVWVFTIKHQSDGYYKICPKGETTCLDLNGGVASDGTNIQIWNDNGSNAQRWSIEDAGDGYYYIRSKVDGRCVDVSTSTATSKSNIHSWTKHGGANQKWKFVSRNRCTGEQTVPDGDYLVMSSLDTNYGLNTEGNSKTSGTNIQINKLTEDNVENFPRFTFTYQNDGTYKVTLKKKHSLCLDMYGGETYRWFSPNVQIYSDNGSDAQRWVVEDAGDGTFFIRSGSNGLCLDVEASQAVNKANVRGWPLNESNSQKWYLIPEQVDKAITDITAFSMVNGIRIRWTLEGETSGKLYRIDDEKPAKKKKNKKAKSSYSDSSLLERFGFSNGPAGVDIKYRIKDEDSEWTSVEIKLSDGANYADIKGLEGGTEYEYTIRPYYQTKLFGKVIGNRRYKQAESDVSKRTTLESNENDINLGDHTHDLIAAAAEKKGWFAGRHVQYYIGTENCKYDMVNKNSKYQMRITYGLVKSKVQYCWEIYDYDKNIYKSVYKGTLSALKEDLAVYADGSKKPRLSTEYVEYKKGDKVSIKLKNASGSAKWSLAKSKNNRIVYGGVKIIKETNNSVTIEFTEKNGKWGVYPYVQAKVGKSIYRCYIGYGERLRW